MSIFLYSSNNICCQILEYPSNSPNLCQPISLQSLLNHNLWKGNLDFATLYSRLAFSSVVLASGQRQLTLLEPFLKHPLRQPLTKVVIIVSLSLVRKKQLKANPLRPPSNGNLSKPLYGESKITPAFFPHLLELGLNRLKYLLIWPTRRRRHRASY